MGHTRRRNRHWNIGNLNASNSRQAVLIVVMMFIHSILDGVAIGVGYATGDLRFGIMLTLAIAVHNIPEGIAVTLLLRAKDISPWTCAGYAILTSTLSPQFK
jgi:zinc transporter, ZIP family